MLDKDLWRDFRDFMDKLERLVLCDFRALISEFVESFESWILL
jgi:hypothetical protein